MENKEHNQLDIRPIPDPTLLTQTMILREISLVKEQFNEKNECMDERIEAKLNTVRTQILERDTRVLIAAHDAKTAIDAAMSAQERAISKSEMSVAKQIDQHGTLLATTAMGLTSKIEDVKERIALLEGTGKGSNDTQMSIVSIIGLLVGLLAGIGGIAVAFVHH